MKPFYQHLAFAIIVVATSASTSSVVRYVDVNSLNPTPPFNDWNTAAINIQDAVDVALSGDQIFVTNGIYQKGGRALAGDMTNRVTVHKPVSIQSINGPQFTFIQGYQIPGTTNGERAIRCVYLTNRATLSGFTLTYGATQWGFGGGGISCSSTSSVISNCVITRNAGGGVLGGTLNDCTVAENTEGGAMSATLNNCTITGNSSNTGGGAYFSTMFNCILSSNSATFGGGA